MSRDSPYTRYNDEFAKLARKARKSQQQFIAPTPTVLREVKTDTIYSPKNLQEFIGQNDIKEILGITIKAARKEKRNLPPLMFTGRYGIGKTALAQVTLREFGSRVYQIDGQSINKDIPRSSGTYIIDEIHDILPEVCDQLNQELDQGLSIIGCTTNPGKLPAPFRSRFMTFFLKPYTEKEISKIAQNICDRK